VVDNPPLSGLLCAQRLLSLKISAKDGVMAGGGASGPVRELADTLPPSLCVAVPANGVADTPKKGLKSGCGSCLVW